MFQENYFWHACVNAWPISSSIIGKPTTGWSLVLLLDSPVNLLNRLKSLSTKCQLQIKLIWRVIAFIYLMFDHPRIVGLHFRTDAVYTTIKLFFNCLARTGNRRKQSIYVFFLFWGAFGLGLSSKGCLRLQLCFSVIFINIFYICGSLWTLEIIIAAKVFLWCFCTKCDKLKKVGCQKQTSGRH